jgi:hypothetical protein
MFLPKKAFEIVGIDPWRWAYFNLLPGIATGFVLLMLLLADMGRRAGLEDILGCIVLILPGTTLIVVLASWLQAFLFNFYISLIVKAPVIVVQEVLQPATALPPKDKSDVADKLRKHAARVKASRQSIPSANDGNAFVEIEEEDDDKFVEIEEEEEGDT